MQPRQISVGKWVRIFGILILAGALPKNGYSSETKTFSVGSIVVVYNGQKVSVSNPGITVTDEGMVTSKSTLKIRLSSKESIEIPLPEFPRLHKSMSMDGFVTLSLSPAIHGVEMSVSHTPSRGDPFLTKAKINGLSLVVRYKFKNGKFVSSEAAYQVTDTGTVINPSEQ